ncbi:RNA polymerase sigma factor [Reyranella sp.]|uniref:RNA polymerase sigma factor n=1 Tax=Reyranella sp. TaxID=1929291 RepID=UPI00272F0BFC|nr:sigma-70 family RNA polymerase sigma factor [Reyranella sp.]MDP2377872.1 sigma-70 family RNA polymerase sigma factor [Reyranella sp.]
MDRAQAGRCHDGRAGEGVRLSAPVHDLVASLARDSTHRLVAALARRLGAGRIAVAEDAVQHALLQALSSWPFKGAPAKPEAWLAVVARNRALDLLRHEQRRLLLAEELMPLAPSDGEGEGRFDRELNDDELALLFAVCHPVLSPNLRVTFALKTVCGLTVTQIASGLLAEPTTIAQRLVRARRQLEAANVPIEPPPPDTLPQRAESVRTALYLMFSEGYSAASGEVLVQPELCIEAVRLARALAVHPMTHGPASDALAALLALTAARLATRVDPEGAAQLLEDQPREQWDAGLIALGLDHLQRSATGEELTIWHLRAEIASLHAVARSTADTDWPRIAALYDQIVAIDGSPMAALARAVAIGHAQGATAGLDAVNACLPLLVASPYGHAAAAAFLIDLQRETEARTHLERALALVRTTPERRLMERRLTALSAGPQSARAPPPG